MQRGGAGKGEPSTADRSSAGVGGVGRSSVSFGQSFSNLPPGRRGACAVPEGTVIHYSGVCEYPEGNLTAGGRCGLGGRAVSEGVDWPAGARRTGFVTHSLSFIHSFILFIHGLD